jgi:hypothetical protein
MNSDIPAASHQWSDRVYVRVSRREIAYLRFLIESYDHLAYMTVLDKYEAVVHLTFSPDQRKEILDFLNGLGQEMSLCIYDPLKMAQEDSLGYSN